MTINQPALAELLADCQPTDGHRTDFMDGVVTVQRSRWNGSDFEFLDFAIPEGATLRLCLEALRPVRLMLGGLKDLLVIAGDDGSGGEA